MYWFNVVLMHFIYFHLFLYFYFLFINYLMLHKSGRPKLSSFVLLIMIIKYVTIFSYKKAAFQSSIKITFIY